MMDESLDDAIDPEDGEKYEALFRKQNPEEWRVQTFEETKKCMCVDLIYIF